MNVFGGTGLMMTMTNWHSGTELDVLTHIALVDQLTSEHKRLLAYLILHCHLGIHHDSSMNATLGSANPLTFIMHPYHVLGVSKLIATQSGFIASTKIPSTDTTRRALTTTRQELKLQISSAGLHLSDIQLRIVTSLAFAVINPDVAQATLIHQLIRPIETSDSGNEGSSGDGGSMSGFSGDISDVQSGGLVAAVNRRLGNKKKRGAKGKNPTAAHQSDDCSGLPASFSGPAATVTDGPKNRAYLDVITDLYCHWMHSNLQQQQESYGLHRDSAVQIVAQEFAERMGKTPSFYAALKYWAKKWSLSTAALAKSLDLTSDLIDRSYDFTLNSEDYLTAVPFLLNLAEKVYERCPDFFVGCNVDRQWINKLLPEACINELRGHYTILIGGTGPVPIDRMICEIVNHVFRPGQTMTIE